MTATGANTTRRRSGLILALLALAAPALAGNADVVFVEAAHEGHGTWSFDVKVRHTDQDPDHWADWWRVRTPEGRELGRRVLLHSHVDEQPFTRSARIEIPREIRIVVVEAHDKLHGLGGHVVTVDLARPSGPGFRVQTRR